MSKKPKYEAQNFFATNNSKASMSHPNYFFAKIGRKYKSFGLTHRPKENHPYYPLDNNPNSDDPQKSYLQKKVLTTDRKYIGKKKPSWNFSGNDLAYVRHLKKKHRKRQKNRR